MKIKKLFLIGIFLCFNSYGQSTFLNCSVTGKKTSVNDLQFSENKLEQSIIYIEVIRKSGNKIFIKIDGSDDFTNKNVREHLITTNKNNSDSRNYNWFYQWTQDTGFVFTDEIKINRVNGFIQVKANSKSPNDRFITTREFNGVCNEIPNTNKF